MHFFSIPVQFSKSRWFFIFRGDDFLILGELFRDYDFLSLSLPTILTKLFRRALSFFRPLFSKKSRPTSPKILLSKNQKTNTPTPLKLPLPLPLTPPHPHLYNITLQPSIIYIYIYPKRLQSLVRSGV